MNQQIRTLVIMWKKGNPFALLVGMQNANWCGKLQIGGESSMEITQKIKNGSAFDPAIPPLGIYPKEPKTLIQKNIYLYVLCSIIYNHQDMKTAQIFISR